MALIKCPECGHMISDKAKACPKCGCPVEFNEGTTPKVSEDVKSNVIITNDSKASTMLPSSPKSTKAFWKNKNHLVALVLTIITIALIVFVIYSSVTHTNKPGVVEHETEENVETGNQDKQDQLVTNKIEYNKESSKVSTKIVVDYPSDGPSVVVDNLRQYIVNELYGTNEYFYDSSEPQYEGDMANGQALVDYMGTFLRKQLTKEYNEQGDLWGTFYINIEIEKKHETNKYVTYGADIEVYTGGNRPYTEVKKKTIRKSDGKTFDIIRNPHDEGLKKLMIPIVKKGVADVLDWDEEDCGLNACFYDDPVPNPYLINGTVVFSYSSSILEQGMASMGDIDIAVKKKDILPYLTDEAKELLEDEVKH